MIITPARRLQNVSEYYFSRKLQEIAKMNAEGKNVINLGIGSPDMAPSEDTINALILSAKKPKVHGYQSYKGIPALRKSMADWYSKVYKVKLDPESEILPLMGSKEGIMHISMAFVDAGDEVLVPNPGYPTYSSVSNLVQANIRYYDLDETKNWAPDLDALEKTDLSKVKLMWVNYPHMPTGAKASDETFKALIAFAHKHKILLCHDNPYSLILHDNNPKSILGYEGAMEVAIELNSLSKSHNMAGWRVGLVCGKREYIDNILKVKSNMDSGMFLPLQEAAVQAFKNSAEWHNAQNKEYACRRDYAYELLDILQCTYSKNQVGMFIWAKVPDSIENVESFVDNILYKAKVFITPGFIFGSRGERYIRISLCSGVEVFKEVIKRIREV